MPSKHPPVTVDDHPLAPGPAQRPSAKGGKGAKGAKALTLGRGLDVGTATLLSAVQEEGGHTLVKSERNAFLEVPHESSVNLSMLTKLAVPYVSWEERLYVLGEASFNLANLLGHDVRRPMCDGFLAPGEKDAIPMMRFMLEGLLGEPTTKGEAVTFSMPAPSVDRDNDTVYHQGILAGLVEKMGFTPRPINEGHAVVYSELEKQDFTGIAVSCGGGMFNVCAAYKTIPAVTFSVSRGGDWIDQHVARVMGIAQPRATSIKEGDLDLRKPKTREGEAIAMYYRNLIEYVLMNLKQRFEASADTPRFTEPVDVVVAGGTALAGGFREVFTEVLDQVGLPIPIQRVRLADDAFTSVVRGCLIAAALHEGQE